MDVAKMNFTSEINTSEPDTSFTACYGFTRSYFVTNSVELLMANCVLNLLISMLAITGNFVVLISIWRTPSLHSPSNILLLGLAFSDLGSGLIAQPIYVVFIIAKIKGLLHLFCVSGLSVYITGYCLVSASVLTTVAVSLDRYIALYLHLRYQEIVTVKRTAIVLAGIWTVSSLVGLTWLWDASVAFPVAVIVISLGTSLTSLAYFRIYRIVNRHRAQIQNQVVQFQAQSGCAVNLKKITKSATSMLMVYCLLLFCYLPYLCVACVTVAAGHTILRQSVFEIAATLMFLNSSLNPFVYCWRLSGIRSAVLKTLKNGA